MSEHELPGSPLDPIIERATELAKDANSAINGVADAVGLTEKVDKNPYAMVGAALGVGYVVGGGLLTPTTARLLKLGFKLASISPLRNQILDAAEQLVDGLVSKHHKQSDPK